MAQSRRSFLGGLLGLAGFGPRLIFAAPPGWSPPKNPKLVFGVVSDTHLRTSYDGKGHGKYWPDKYFVAALKYFRDQNVDAVVHCGDMAHRGQILELEFHARAWNKVFPKNLAPDGHKVEKLFVTGNHDVEGGTYGGFVEKIYPNPVERAKHVLVTDMAANWRRIWGEPYEPIWHKCVKGYHFFGRHYGVDEAELSKLVASKREAFGLLNGTEPFFLLSHRRSHAAFHGAMKPYRKAVAFFGHWHRTAVNWNVIYFWSSFPSIQVPSCEPRGSGAFSDDAYISKSPLEGKEAAGKCRQGYVVRVYHDMMVIQRREFGEGGSLGQDWIMPLGEYAPHPLSKESLKKRVGEPQFKNDAKVEVASSTFTPEAGKPAVPALKIDIPLADGNPDSRVYAYDVVVAAKGGSEKIFKSVYAAGCNMGVGHETNHGVTTLFIPKAKLPKGGSLTIAVRPLSSLGTKGRAIAKEVTSEE